MVIRDHISVEDALLADLDVARLPDRWRETWQAGIESSLTLRHDWRDFLTEWDRTAIADDLAGFRDEAMDMLGRIGDRIELGTRTIYAVALQTGKIALI